MYYTKMIEYYPTGRTYISYFFIKLHGTFGSTMESMEK